MPNTAGPPAATRRAGGLLVLALAAGWLIWRLRPGSTGRDPVAEIVLGCAWLGWLVAGWLTLGVAVRAGSHLARPRGPGGAVERLGRCAPGRLGRLVDTVITVGLAGALVGGPIVPAAAARAAAPAAVSHQIPSGAPLQWPGLPARPAPHPHPSTHRAPQHRAASVGLVSAAPRRGRGHGHGPEQLVTVHSGDSLWSLAAARLGPASTAEQIAAAWPRWYARNRDVIGADPSLIVPGQRLRPPAQRPAGSGP
jgi:uncharacterized membrane protein YeaQ/YmgE (transglycosylase-associated protein family)